MEGVYVLVVLIFKKLIGVWDLFGICLFVFGDLNGVLILVLEICVFDIIGVKFICEVENGEVIVCILIGIQLFFLFGK